MVLVLLPLMSIIGRAQSLCCQGDLSVATMGGATIRVVDLFPSSLSFPFFCFVLALCFRGSTMEVNGD